VFENVINFIKKIGKKQEGSKSAAKERLQLVLMQDRANVSADYLDLMKQEIIEVIKKYIDIDEKALEVELTKPKNKDGTFGAPSLYANIPILNIKTTKAEAKQEKKEEKNSEQVKQNNKTQKVPTETKENKNNKATDKKEKNTDNKSAAKNDEVNKQETTKPKRYLELHDDAGKNQCNTEYRRQNHCL